jgi:hypothetical protein
MNTEAEEFPLLESVTRKRLVNSEKTLCELQLQRYLKCVFVCVSERESYFMTGGLPPISSSWHQTLETHAQYFFSSEHLQL